MAGLILDQLTMTALWAVAALSAGALGYMIGFDHGFHNDKRRR